QEAIQASIALCAQRLSLRLLRALEQAAEAITAALATDPANLRGLADTLARLANARCGDSAGQRSERTGWCLPALRPVPGEGGSRAGKPGSTGNEGQGGRPGAFLAGTLAGFRAVTASPVPT